MKPLFSLFFLIVLLSCTNAKKETETVTETADTQEHILVSKAQFKTENMTMDTLSEQEFNNTISCTGLIDVPPLGRASITTFMQGYIKSTALLVGDEVKKGQRLVTLENPEFVELQQNYLEVWQKLAYLKAEFNRQKTLYDENITSEKNYLKAESEYKSNLAYYNGLKQKLNMLNLSPKQVEQGTISSTINVYAPISGYITKVNVSNGVFVSAATEIMEIINTDTIHLELLVFEKDVLHLKKGMQVQFKIPEASDTLFKAQIYLVGTSIDPIDKTIKIYARIEEKEEITLVNGMFAEAEIVTESYPAMALPKDAVVEIDGIFYALVLNHEDDKALRFAKTEVNPGKTNAGFVELKNPQAFKDKQVLSKGTFMLLTASE
ncbi:MAG TPA: efflux RND transporter periplasmic adaptor subunit [Flavobacteriaceae bacterium]|nr:efflux RND transporter periplasmic adaptor subunit [Flavobacteriaceae bacterium]